ncbi:hypothetical protein BDP67DRAFT_490348 [Colletotrichum lupini]|nr:hypothetical protein BDP67DRAFT_490348 [Colletotrichum lupini]
MEGKHERREAMSGVFTARVASSDLKACRNAHGSPITPSRGIAGYASVSKDWQDYFESLIYKNFILRLQDLIPFREHIYNNNTPKDDVDHYSSILRPGLLRRMMRPNPSVTRAYSGLPTWVKVKVSVTCAGTAFHLR